MHRHADFVGWLFAEALLSLPAIVGLVGLTLAGPFRELRVMPRDTFMQVVLYPYVGAAIAAVLGVGVGEIYAGKPDGVLILGAGALAPIYLGGYAGKLLRKDQREDTDLFGPNCWLPDIERLRTVDQLERHERSAYQKRADEVGFAGREKCLEVQESRFGAFWRSRKRRVRIIGYAWFVIGALFAVSGVRTVGSAWCIAALPLGASWLGGQWVVWHLENSVKNAVGRNLLEGAEQIRKRLGDLPSPREPCSAWSRFRHAAFRWRGLA
jgi:hypothetical protein